MPEGRRVFADLTVLENLEVPAYARRAKQDDFQAHLDQVFDLFPILAERRAADCPETKVVADGLQRIVGGEHVAPDRLWDRGNVPPAHAVSA